MIPDIFTDLDSSELEFVAKVPFTKLVLIGYNVKDSKWPSPTISSS